MSESGVQLAKDAVQFRRTLPGPIERVWAFLTESDKRAKWLAAGEIELRVGGRVQFEFDHTHLSAIHEPIPERFRDRPECERMTGTVTQCDPPRLLSYTWIEEGAGESEVTFELTPQGENVLLVVTHRRAPNRAYKVGVSGGWHTHLDILVDYLNGRPPRPFWSTFLEHEARYEQPIPKE